MLKNLSLILYTYSMAQVVFCSTYCDFKKIFQTPVDSSRFDNYEILERGNFGDAAKDPISQCDSHLPKAIANAQVLVHVQSEKSKCKEACSKPPPPCQLPYPHYPFLPYNPFMHHYPVYPYHLANFPYPNWMVPPPVESKLLVLDKPLVVLEEDPQTAVQIDDVFEIPCDTVIKTCECEDTKSDQKDVKDCYDEEKIIEDILNYKVCTPLDTTECQPKIYAQESDQRYLKHDCPHEKVVLEDIPIASCLPKECDKDEISSKIIYCPFCKKICDKPYCPYCQKELIQEPCKLEIPLHQDCCSPPCMKDGTTHQYCSQCKAAIKEPCEDLNVPIVCDQDAESQPCTVVVDPSAGPPAPDCILIKAHLIDLEKLPTCDVSDVIERENLHKCQEGTRKCYRCQNCYKQRPPIGKEKEKCEDQYDTEDGDCDDDDDDLPGVLVEDDDEDDREEFPVFIYDPNKGAGSDEVVKELTLEELNKATDLVNVLAGRDLKEITEHNTGDDVSIETLCVPEEHISKFPDDDRACDKKKKRRGEGKYYFLDGSKLGGNPYGCCGCSACADGVKKQFKYDIDDLNEQIKPKCNQLEVLLPKSSPVYVTDENPGVEYPHPGMIPYRCPITSTVPYHTDKTPYPGCRCNPCRCANPTKCCSCQYPCPCQKQVLPLHIPCDQDPCVIRCRSNERPCSSCAPYVGELVTLSSY